jgi:sugar diacid utilization regulator
MAAGVDDPLRITSLRPSLGALCEQLGDDLLSISVAPRGLDAPFADVIVHDPSEPLVAGSGDIILAVGIAVETSAARELIERAAELDAAAVVFKSERRASDVLRDAAEDSGVTLLTAPEKIAWGQLYGLIRTFTSAQTGTSADQAAGAAIGDLFALADAVATAAGGHVTIEDPQSRVLAFSNLDGPVDAGREATILGRRVPEHWMKKLRETGTFARLAQSEQVVRVEFPGEAAPRRAIAISASGWHLGSIWVAEGERPLDEATDSALEEAARVAALHLLRHRVSDDLERRLRAEMLAALLSGEESAEAVAAKLGLPHRSSFVVVAVRASRGEAPALSLAHERIVDPLAMYFSAFRRHAVAAVCDGCVYLLVTADPAQPLGWLVKLASEAVSSAARNARDLSFHVGVGAHAASIADVPRSRIQADQALRVAHSRGGESVLSIEDCYGDALMLEVADFIRSRPVGRSHELGLLDEQDREHGTEYVHTLAVYLRCFGNSASAAARLHVHPNTLRYRIRRIMEIADLDLEDGERRLSLELQLRIMDGS